MLMGTLTVPSDCDTDAVHSLFCELSYCAFPYVTVAAEYDALDEFAMPNVTLVFVAPSKLNSKSAKPDPCVAPYARTFGSEEATVVLSILLPANAKLATSCSANPLGSTVPAGIACELLAQPPMDQPSET